MSREFRKRNYQGKNKGEKRRVPGKILERADTVEELKESSVYLEQKESKGE